MLLAEFVARYFALKGHEVAFKGHEVTVFEQSSGSPLKTYAFDRKTVALHQGREEEGADAELVRFNGDPLESFLQETERRGAFAKGFFPFSVDAEAAFERGLKRLVVRGPSAEPRFLLNGELGPPQTHVGYLPFLLLLLRIELESVDRVTLVDRLVVPVHGPDQDEKVVEFFAGKVAEAFERPDPVVLEAPPLPGEVLEFSDETARKALDAALARVEGRVGELRRELAGRAGDRLEREVAVLNQYYDARERELEARIEDARERSKDSDKTDEYRRRQKEKADQLTAELDEVRSERRAKEAEYRRVYSVDWDYEVAGLAAVYFPADFHFSCSAEAPSGTKQVKFYYDALEDALLPPNCECGCGQPVHQAILDHATHLVRPGCGAACVECGRLSCAACGRRDCVVCGDPLCDEHAVECFTCREKNKPARWGCSLHVGPVAGWDVVVCDGCATSCGVCGARVADDPRGSARCSTCGRTACHSHHAKCPICGLEHCDDCTVACQVCGARVGAEHVRSGECQTCRGASVDAFVRFFVDHGFPPFEALLEILGASKGKGVKVVKLGEREVVVPKQLVGVRAGENAAVVAFRISRWFEEVVVVLNLSSWRWVARRRPRGLGKLVALLKRRELPGFVDLNVRGEGGGTS
ncbi:MAG: hypothetical protein Kow0069_34200 [Promethearchaeota archaeon]